jgi:hypothetical protein
MKNWKKSSGSRIPQLNKKEESKMRDKKIAEIKIPDYLRPLFQKMPLINIGEDADLSEETVNKVIKLCEEDDRLFLERIQSGE